MIRTSRGFTLVELMIVVVIIGILAAILVPNVGEFHKRAKEGGTKSNMHTLQISTEDYGVQNAGTFPSVMDATHIADGLPPNFNNAFTGFSGSGVAWEDRASYAAVPSAVAGIVSYADSGNTQYNVKGQGSATALLLTLTSGQ